jgi:hypothetical protein
MDITCEIFKKLPEGPIWVETVTGLEQTKGTPGKPQQN